MKDARATMRVSPASVPALILGVSGLFPFVGLASMIGFGPDAWYHYSLMALAYYGAVILTFVGALHWGYALKRSALGGEAWLQYGFSVAPALMAWLSLLLPVWTALRLQAAGLLICYVFDRTMARNDSVPEWFMKLRAVLTVLGAASLTLASLF
jgi:hypothetical protein